MTKSSLIRRDPRESRRVVRLKGNNKTNISLATHARQSSVDFRRILVVWSWGAKYLSSLSNNHEETSQVIGLRSWQRRRVCLFRFRGDRPQNRQLRTKCSRITQRQQMVTKVSTESRIIFFLIEWEEIEKSVCKQCNQRRNSYLPLRHCVMADGFKFICATLHTHCQLVNWSNIRWARSLFVDNANLIAGSLPVFDAVFYFTGLFN